jgi:hypothetical protein
LKAVMVEAGVRVPRIHDLEALLNMLASQHPTVKLIASVTVDGGDAGKDTPGGKFIRRRSNIRHPRFYTAITNGRNFHSGLS